MTSIRRPELPALTSLRFFAALYVVIFHGGQHFAKSEFAHSLVASGFVAVDFFFVLSGFVLAYRYVSENHEMSASKRSFWVARLARVYPVYVLGILIGAPLYIQTVSSGHSHANALILLVVSLGATLLLVQGWYYRTATAWNTPAWSLSVEAFLYAAFPFAMPWLARRAHTERRRIGLMALCAVISLICPVAYVLLKPDAVAGGLDDSGRWLDTLRFNPLVHLPSFLLGILAGLHHLRRTSRSPAGVAFALLVAIVVVLALSSHIPHVLLHTGLLAPLFAALIYFVAGDEGMFSRALSVQPLVVLGDASYALYLLHFPLLQYAQRTVTQWTPWTLLAFIVLLQLICIWVYRWIETPSRISIRSLLRGR
jgi:peptidoglycan/LPS O-acetylase OafA/YrhL